jgi:hypothetical protein
MRLSNVRGHSPLIGSALEGVFRESQVSGQSARLFARLHAQPDAPGQKTYNDDGQ